MNYLLYAIVIVGTFLAILAAYVASMSARNPNPRKYFRQAIYWPLTVVHLLYWLLVDDGEE